MIFNVGCSTSGFYPAATQDTYVGWAVGRGLFSSIFFSVDTVDGSEIRLTS